MDLSHKLRLEERALRADLMFDRGHPLKLKSFREKADTTR